jgi:predicted  nucleic acid-binding Zn-ribbon protein
VENQDLKLNIISLNDTIEDLRNKKQKLTSIIDAKTEELKDLEKQKLVAESKNKQILETNELSTLEENLRTILSQVIV